MNYQRIYSEFISDRRIKETSIAGYSEIHHILPRSLGGDNSEDNLIRLTAEDHIRAHLLLAKIYGGKQWLPVRFIFGQRERRGAIPSRIEIKMAAIVRQKCAEQSVGENHPNYGNYWSEDQKAQSSKQTKEWHRSGAGRATFIAAMASRKQDPALMSSVARLAYQKDPTLRKKNSDAQKAYFARPESRDKTSKATRAAMARPEVKASAMARYEDPVFMKKLSERMTGDRNPAKRPEVAAKVAEANRGKKRSVESRRKQSMATLGVIKTKAHAANISKGIAEYHAQINAFCAQFGIAKPGRSGSNVDKAAFRAWQAQQENGALGKAIGA